MVIDVKSEVEVLPLKLSIYAKPMYLLKVYHPPGSQDKNMLPFLLDEVARIVDASNEYLVVYGDFNLPKIDWNTYTSNGALNLYNPCLAKVADFTLEQHIFKPMHIKGNILDPVFTNKQIIKNVEILIPLLSDHSIIHINLSIDLMNVKREKDISIYFIKKQT